MFNSKFQFKFLISNEEDYQYAKSTLLSSLRDGTNIIFQPEWESKEFTKKLVELIKRDGLNVKIILQQQKVILGEKRGV